MNLLTVLTGLCYALLAILAAIVAVLLLSYLLPVIGALVILVLAHSLVYCAIKWLPFQ